MSHPIRLTGCTIHDEWSVYANKRICIPCRRAYDKKRNATPERKRFVKNKNLRRNFNISIEEYEARLEKQNFRCAICNDKLTEGKGGATMDHCHETGKLREVLCSPCNKGLDHFRDDIARMEAALEYLKKWTN